MTSILLFFIGGHIIKKDSRTKSYPLADSPQRILHAMVGSKAVRGKIRVQPDRFVTLLGEATLRQTGDSKCIREHFELTHGSETIIGEAIIAFSEVQNRFQLAQVTSATDGIILLTGNWNRKERRLQFTRGSCDSTAALSLQVD
ncbi:DUF1579 domain-containing protein [candidate division KSB1 bacterium]|nr:DUF1579 domain-containing protein [candidate division KSB1 bacterium]NIR69244.1 DUF1579 domain-containing protein [candidate division KSB1 bacterium]NIS27418.1 DUF1579 domain-containing protein [candidate division KSB1 bacterium]NIT74243.1 DUF1579 domain-containing protein [candidate division KSB1 bacterium]NIU28135.1 DUF1579 domain-containing protein [candidate division KSB1 bacterium]